MIRRRGASPWISLSIKVNSRYSQIIDGILSEEYRQLIHGTHKASPEDYTKHSVCVPDAVVRRQVAKLRMAVNCCLNKGSQSVLAW